MTVAPALAERVPRHGPLSPVLSSESRDDTASIVSSQGISSLDSRSCLSVSATSLTRRNEHLAVLLSKDLWKPDRQASQCDVFVCRKRFSIWERRHHCRKCGGVVCSDCSTRATALLDTSNLEFLNPPRDVPIQVFDSPTSPVVMSRVCDDCWDQIHGSRSPRSPMIKRSMPIAVATESDSSSSSAASSVSTPSDDGLPIIPPSIRRVQTSPRIASSPLRTNSLTPQPPAGPLVSDSELSLGELESTMCKASGGGRWTPKPCMDIVGYRIPGAKAIYEIELEREEEERRRYRANPIFRDGDFQLRVPREIEPRSPAGPIQLSTF
ncbi:FYVE-domain-containing protein [Amylocystis lapponica]|nr:FYVE-domain-containing protein [Amylocystis lapponica]